MRNRNTSIANTYGRNCSINATKNDEANAAKATANAIKAGRSEAVKNFDLERRPYTIVNTNRNTIKSYAPNTTDNIIFTYCFLPPPEKAIASAIIKIPKTISTPRY